MSTGQKNLGFTIVEDVEEMKEIIMDETNAAIVYVALRN